MIDINNIVGKYEYNMNNIVDKNEYELQVMAILFHRNPFHNICKVLTIYQSLV